MKFATIGLDLAQNVFQVRGGDEHSFAVLRKQLKRKQVASFFACVEPCLSGIEACGRAHHWAAKLTALGHHVKIMALQFVKPYVADFNDRGRLFQSDRGRRFNAIVDARGLRASEVVNVSQSSTISLKRGASALLLMRLQGGSFGLEVALPGRRRRIAYGARAYPLRSLSGAGTIENPRLTQRPSSANDLLVGPTAQ